MGMGSYAVNGFVIEYGDLKDICPHEIGCIESNKYFPEIGWGGIAAWQSWDDDDNVRDFIYDAVDSEDESVIEQIVNDTIAFYDQSIKQLKASFNRTTGLTLYFDHYDEDGGGRYDQPSDHEGCIFCVDGMVQLTPAGEKYKDIVTERSWTQYG